MDCFDKLINHLSAIKQVNDIFDVSSLSDEDFLIKMLRYKHQNDLASFYAKNLLILINEDIPFLTTRDFYEDDDFRILIELFEGLPSESTDFKSLILSNLDKVAKLYTLLLMFLCVGYMELNLKVANSLNDFENEYEFQYVSGSKKAKYSYFWYRGVTSIDEHDLIPSMYRSINDPYIHIDDAFIDKQYNSNSLINEYKKIFRGPFSKNDFIAYMQHSIAYSPFLDFTRNINVASSFATAFTNPEDFRKKDAGIYLLVRDARVNTRPYKRNIELFNKKLTPFTIVFRKPIFLLTISDFYVKYNVVLNKTNDRMKYQDGLFLNIYKAVFVKKKLLFPNSTSSLFVKRIPFSGGALTKDSIIKDIEMRHNHYSIDYLMDPYKWFGKRH